MSQKRKKSTQNVDFDVHDVKWSGRRDSNSRPSGWQPDALPTELLPQASMFIGSSIPCQLFFIPQQDEFSAG